ncbi:hypothetical protein LENED_001770 [Lentinula edodes]|uniref:Uncharacterized protein n=1 Tax=Lentinula edodes TaxID=5353 RepID=A0A1Q3DZ27_LENED|nr:hypothetical protein LENED_001770 [Lentinula edodes]
MRPKQPKLKAPKFKIKEYNDPGYSKYVVVTNPWSRPSASSGNGRRENPEVVKERFANTIGGWFENMTGKRVETIYFQSNKEFIIVELDSSVNVDPILGAHHTQDFFKNSTRAEISEIYLTFSKWESISPNYDKADLANLRVKEKKDYPPPRKPQALKPPTHFAQPLSSEVQELLIARRASYDESLPANARLPDPPSPSPQDRSPSQTSLLNNPGPLSSATLHVPPPESFVPYVPPAFLDAMRNNKQSISDLRQVESHLDPGRRSVTLDDERDPRRSLLSIDSRRHTGEMESQRGRIGSGVNVVIKPEPQTHDIPTDFQANAVHRQLKVEGSKNRLIPKEEQHDHRLSQYKPEGRASQPFKQPKIEDHGDALPPKKEEEPESHVSEERIRLWNELQGLIQAQAPSNPQVMKIERSDDSLGFKREGTDDRGFGSSSSNRGDSQQNQAKVEGPDEILLPKREEPENHVSEDRIRLWNELQSLLQAQAQDNLNTGPEPKVEPDAKHNTPAVVVKTETGNIPLYKRRSQISTSTNDNHSQPIRPKVEDPDFQIPKQEPVGTERVHQHELMRRPEMKPDVRRGLDVTTVKSEHILPSNYLPKRDSLGQNRSFDAVRYTSRATAKEEEYGQSRYSLDPRGEDGLPKPQTHAVKRERDDEASGGPGRGRGGDTGNSRYSDSASFWKTERSSRGQSGGYHDTKRVKM